MSKVAIVTDSSAYLPKALVEQYGLTVIPLTLTWDGVNYRDGVDIAAKEFYTRQLSAKTLATTSQIPVVQFTDVFKPLLDSGHDVFYTGISSGISASLQSAEQAKVELGNPSNLCVMDSQQVAMSLGLMVLTAARAVEAGADLKGCQQAAEDAFTRTQVFFTVNTLEYLHRGGRINTAARLLGSTLNLKPVMEIRGGKIELVESVRSRKNAINRLLDLAEKGINGRTPVRLSPFHALCEEEALALEAAAVERFHPVEVIRSEISPVIGAHVGPGTLALAFMAG